MHRPIQIALLVTLAAHLAACGDARPGARDAAARAVDTTRARLTVDDFGDSIGAGEPARRIVSLNPSTTEMLFAIGAGGRLVGRSRWDLYPDSAARVPDVGDALRPNVEAVLATRPDLVVLYASNDNRDAARRLRAAGVRTISLKADRIADLDRTATLLGMLAGEPARARQVVDSVRRTLDAVRERTRSLPRPTVFWPLWDEPLYAVGGGSFLNDLVEIAGGRNVYTELPQPSPAVSAEDVLRRDPDVLVASPAMVARYRASPAWRSLRAVRTGRVLVFDTSLTARPGVRLGEAAESLARLLHPPAPSR